MVTLNYGKKIKSIIFLKLTMTNIGIINKNIHCKSYNKISIVFYLNKNTNIHIGKAVKKVDTNTKPTDKKNEATIDDILFFLFGLKYAYIE
jgi:hypothetical protein